MSQELQDLYQEVILDHSRSPRNFRALPDATCDAQGHNPLCGDRITIHLKTGAGGTFSDISFEGSGCAISTASASLLTELLRDRDEKYARTVAEKFHRLVMGTATIEQLEDEPGPGLGKLAVFAGVSEFPARVKCASLALYTLKQALERKTETATTE